MAGDRRRGRDRGTQIADQVTFTLIADGEQQIELFGEEFVISSRL